jgi:Peptidase family M23
MMNMNKKFLYGAMLVMLAASVAPPAIAVGAIKLPYQKGQEFVVVQGYNSPPTHINKDADAIDFSQNGCDAYGKIVAASAGGVVELAEENGYNGGYGTQVLVDEGNHVVARYAHMIPGTIPFAVGATVVQGQQIGAVGNTGLVAGAACATHPGTHLHFAMYYQNADGSFAAVLPEPISGYRDITEGRWYLSDNDIESDADTDTDANANLSADINAIVVPTAMSSSIPSATTAAITSNFPVIVVTSTFATATSTPTPTTSATTSTTNPATTTNTSSSGGGVVATVAAPSTPAAPPITTTTTSTTTTPPSSPTYSISFNSSTLAVDLSWQATSTTAASATTYVIYKTDPSNASNTIEVATTTATSYSYVLAPGDFGNENYFEIDDASGSTIAFATTTAPAWFTTIQPIDDENSNGSWYEDNWYDLGTGFYGLIRSLTLEGFIDSSDYFASHAYLDEYLDPNYTQLNQTYTISNNAPFTNGLQKITIGGLAIPLQPNKYYRLRTYQDYQNSSVILVGTSATGTAMWDQYIYGTGIVRNIYSFYPYLAGVIIPNYPPFAAPNPPANATTSFDSLNSVVDFSWSPATDPDTTSSLLTYQWNITSSTSGGTPAFDPAAWQSVGKTFSASAPVVFDDAYTIGIRAIDDLGNIGQPLVVPWNFPAGYYPPPQQLDHSAWVGSGGGAQEITFTATTTLSDIVFWLGPGGGGYCCSITSVSLHGDASGTPGAVIATSDQVEFTYSAPGHEWDYSFSPSLTLSPGAYWFSVDQAGLNNVNVGGSAGDSYSGGTWSTSPGQDAYFRIAE